MGKGTGKSVLPLLAGIRLDLESLMARFKENVDRSFAGFARIFADAGCSHIFEGRQTVAEVSELCSSTLAMCVPYCVPPRATDPLDQATGIFALYALYNVQPLRHKQRILITPSQARELASAERQWTSAFTDAVYCYNWLAADDAFVVTAFQEFHSALSTFRYDAAMTALEPSLDVDNSSKNLDALSKLVTDSLLSDAHALHKVYRQEKQKLVAGMAAAGRTHASILQHLAKEQPDPRAVVLRERDQYFESIARLFYRPNQNAADNSATNDNSNSNEGQSLSRRRARLRESAYTGEVASPKHRTNRKLGAEATEKRTGKKRRRSDSSGGESVQNQQQVDSNVRPVDEEMEMEKLETPEKVNRGRKTSAGTSDGKSTRAKKPTKPKNVKNVAANAKSKKSPKSGGGKAKNASPKTKKQKSESAKKVETPARPRGRPRLGDKKD